jgi:hypothetical protein
MTESWSEWGRRWTHLIPVVPEKEVSTSFYDSSGTTGTWHRDLLSRRKTVYEGSTILLSHDNKSGTNAHVVAPLLRNDNVGGHTLGRLAATWHAGTGHLRSRGADVCPPVGACPAKHGPL